MRKKLCTVYLQDMKDEERESNEPSINSHKHMNFKAAKIFLLVKIQITHQMFIFKQSDYCIRVLDFWI